jgi:hypothetical protein
MDKLGAEKNPYDASGLKGLRAYIIAVADSALTNVRDLAEEERDELLAARDSLKVRMTALAQRLSNDDADYARGAIEGAFRIARLAVRSPILKRRTNISTANARAGKPDVGRRFWRASKTTAPRTQRTGSGAPAP